MKRGFVVISLAVLVLAAGNACGSPAGDGDLVDDWAAMADAKVRVPETGKCYNTANRARDSYAPTWHIPVSCTGPHGVETFHVGELPASATVAPAVGDREYWAAFDECEKQSKTFLGGDWYAARLYLAVFVPSAPQWEVGARWYACQLIETKNVTSTLVLSRTASLQNALSGAAPVAHRCTNIIGLTADSWDEMEPVDCAQPHDAEYAGVYKAPGTTFPTGDQRESLDEECWNVVARYLNGTVSGMQMGYVSWGLEKKDWSRGDRWVRCFAWSDEKKVVGSVKGLGNRTPPG